MSFFFPGRPDINRPYIFPKLGDEIPGVGCPDLHCTFRGISDWSTVLKKADLAGYDCNVNLEITADDVKSGRKIIFDLYQEKIVDSDSKPIKGVSISCSDFKPLYDRLRIRPEGSSKAYEGPTSKKRRFDNSEVKTELSTVKVKLVGLGPEVLINGGISTDLNVNLILKL